MADPSSPTSPVAAGGGAKAVRALAAGRSSTGSNGSDVPPFWDRAGDREAPFGLRPGMRFEVLEDCEPNGSSAGPVSKGDLLTVKVAVVSEDDSVLVQWEELEGRCNLYEPADSSFADARAQWKQTLLYRNDEEGRSIIHSLLPLWVGDAGAAGE